MLVQHDILNLLNVIYINIHHRKVDTFDDTFNQRVIPMLCDAIRRLVGTHNEDFSTKISHVMDVRACVGKSVMLWMCVRVWVRACVCVCVCVDNHDKSRKYI